ncbi:MAG: hypothetical protein KAV82_00485 [Phycisphaerae bacterium]|nr:hypothetical protein [Phycisphaerae bacterium]
MLEASLIGDTSSGDTPQSTVTNQISVYGGATLNLSELAAVRKTPVSSSTFSMPITIYWNESISATGGSLLTLGGGTGLTLNGSSTRVGYSSRDPDGGITPPSLRLIGTSRLCVMGDLELIDRGQVMIEDNATLELSGNLSNSAQVLASPPQPDANTIFAMENNTKFVFANPDATELELECASEDVGPCQAGFEDTFAFAKLVIAPHTTVGLEDLHANHDPQLPEGEVVYVRELILQEGATLLLHGHQLYYQDLSCEYPEEQIVP